MRKMRRPSVRSFECRVCGKDRQYGLNLCSYIFDVCEECAQDITYHYLRQHYRDGADEFEHREGKRLDRVAQ